MARQYFYLNTNKNTYVLRVGKNFPAEAWREFNFGFKHLFGSNFLNLFRIKSVRR